MNRCVQELVSFFVYDIPISYLFCDTMTMLTIESLDPLLQLAMPSICMSTPPWRIRLKACVDLGDQTAEFVLFEVIRTAILTYFYLFLGINLRILISVINTRFQPDAPG